MFTRIHLRKLISAAIIASLLTVLMPASKSFAASGDVNTSFSKNSQLPVVQLVSTASPTTTEPSLSHASASTPDSSVSPAPTSTPDTSGILGTAVVKLVKGSLNVRLGPGSSYKRIGTASKNTCHDVYAEQNGWLKIQLGTRFGWISKKYVVYSLRSATVTQSTEESRSGDSANPDDAIDDSTPIGTGIVNTVSGSLCVRKGPGTKYSAVYRIAKGETVDIMSISGSWYCISYEGSFGYASKSYIKVINITQATASVTMLPADADPLVSQIKGTVKLIDWFGKDGLREFWQRGSYFTLVDVRTGTVMQMKYWRGTNHADIEPATKADTAALKACYGGRWTWNRRPVWAIINGQAYAGSINGMPHSGDTLPNNGMRGQICLHFVGSKTHCDYKVDPDHKSAIEQAYLAGK